MTAPTPGVLLREGADRLRRAGRSTPEADARLLLASVLGVSPGRLALVGAVPHEAAERFWAVVARRERGEPVQHLTGRAWFRRVELTVGPGVFVPRPETEVMTGWAVDRLRELLSAGRTPVAVELCAGSGVISLAIRDEVGPRVELHAVELSDDALPYAERNLAGADVDLRLGDMADAFSELDGAVDLVIANPPYIPIEAYESVPAEVRDHDPAIALFSGTDGLDALRVVVAVAARLLRSGGWLCSEHAEVQSAQVVDLLASSGRFREIRDHRDLTDRARFVTARKFSGLKGDGSIDRVSEQPEPQGGYRRLDCTDPSDSTALAAAAEAAREAVEDGECVVLPTDTVYGIGADAFSATAVERLLAAKGRGRDMPPPVLIADPRLLRTLAVDVPPAAMALVEAFWPGPLTVICKAQHSLRMDLGDTRGTVALRVPDHPLARELLRRTGPLAVSSANATGQPPATSVDDAIAQLGNAVAVYLDGGSVAANGTAPSTMVDFSFSTDGELLRRGALDVEAIRGYCPDLVDLTGPMPESGVLEGLPEPGVLEGLPEPDAPAPELDAPAAQSEPEPVDVPASTLQPPRPGKPSETRSGD